MGILSHAASDPSDKLPEEVGPRMRLDSLLVKNLGRVGSTRPTAAMGFRMNFGLRGSPAGAAVNMTVRPFDAMVQVVFTYISTIGGVGACVTFVVINNNVI